MSFVRFKSGLSREGRALLLGAVGGDQPQAIGHISSFKQCIASELPAVRLRWEITVGGFTPTALRLVHHLSESASLRTSVRTTP